MGIGKAVVDRAHSAAAAIGEIGHLHRSGFAGKDEQPIAGSMTGEIEEKIDAIFANPPGQQVVGNVLGFMPFRSARP